MDKKVAICVPSSDQVWADFAFSINACLIYTLMNGLPISAIINKKGSIIHQARCALVKDAADSGATHLMFADSDHIFPKDSITKLAAHDKDVVGVHCTTKRHPIRSNCEGLDGKRLTKMGEGLQEVKHLGTGLMLIDMKVFKKMRTPHFNFAWDNKAGWRGEDFYFCDRVREQGFKIYVDHEVSKDCYHIGPAVYSPRDLKEQA